MREKVRTIYERRRIPTVVVGVVFLLLLLVLDLCYALGEGGITTITDGRKISEGVYPPYMKEDKESRLLSWGSFLLLLLVLDLCYALGEGGVTTITDGRKC